MDASPVCLVLAQSDSDGKLDTFAFVSMALPPVEPVEYLQTESVWQGFGDVFIFQLNLLAGTFTVSDECWNSTISHPVLLHSSNALE